MTNEEALVTIAAYLRDFDVAAAVEATQRGLIEELSKTAALITLRHDNTQLVAEAMLQLTGCAMAAMLNTFVQSLNLHLMEARS